MAEDHTRLSTFLAAQTPQKGLLVKLHLYGRRDASCALALL